MTLDKLAETLRRLGYYITITPNEGPRNEDKLFWSVSLTKINHIPKQKSKSFYHSAQGNVEESVRDCIDQVLKDLARAAIDV